MSHVNTLLLHRYRAGEVVGDERSRVDAHLATCEDCARRLGVQRDARAAFEAEPLPAPLAAVAAPANRPFGRALWGVVPLIVAATALVVALLPPPAEDPSGTRTKGHLPDVELWVGTARGPRPARDTDVLRSGAQVQVLYDANGAQFAVLAGRDGTGDVEIYGELPPHDTLQPAPFALTLDDAPGPQEFFVVTADARFALADVQAALRGERPDLRVRAVSVRKE